MADGLHFLKFFLRGEASWADPVVWKFIEGGSWEDLTYWIAFLWIIDPSALLAFILFHNPVFLFNSGPKQESYQLLHVKEKSFQVLSFRMVDVYRVVARLVQTVQDAYAASSLGCCREDCKSESFLVHYLRAAVCEDETAWGYF